MIDDISEPGAWARELAMQPRRCEHCRHYRRVATRFMLGSDDPVQLWHACALNRPLKPCADFEREPGADDGE